MDFIIALVALVLGIGGGYFVRKLIAQQSVASAETKAAHLIEETRTKQKELLVEAKDKALAVIEEAKREKEVQMRDVAAQQRRLQQREELFDRKLLEFEDKQQQLQDARHKVDHVKEELLKLKEDSLKKLEAIAGLTREEAARTLLERTERDVKDELLSRIRKLERETSEEWERRARHYIATAMERCASSHAVETTTTVVALPNDEMKGRIIGREGRNIKAFEQLTGVEIVVDETPQTIVISGFSLLRRHIAKIALEKLILDGRIHPGRIEEALDAAKKEIALEIKKAGEDAAYEVGVVGLDPKLLQILGRLKYRTSYGHNVLAHSIEVGHLSGLLAEELGANVTVAKKGGLLHDIGKAVDHEIQGAHTDLGRDIMKKFGLPEEIAYIAIAHHEDHPSTLEGIIVKVADAISGARPGARKDTFEQYVQRLEELEKLATSFEGVEKCYAIQAGREIRVFVHPDKIDDWTAQKLARDIANKIEAELKYPGEIRVTLIRERRVIEYAR
ncbi:ribonuclease Y [Candidatus Uhrbacteria bacterium RIFCSPHIGHO2_12_FULL_54_23]|uniref:Ribonuclease Y n=3 Tax=Candidatus Uhriibacteriota TaxID=1752732 RepID=A0A1F7UHL3_9BACT|nr:MAG: ribonuclease Y [Candidatus Uhrbacteria bacterium RIFCSPHIGHO2_12_FULL_54_23]OGL83645.1 MAG: ribonuclease Y [Candidatus Uhrbacteria bacterium RIFCSPLOWO2_01_FULL_55_36]OGL89808.1 MAG: ribonuclease Y [Candidatus Uhrbacteria bacterium RIFCSPLOWO2_02_FULL_54_37]